MDMIEKVARAIYYAAGDSTDDRGDTFPTDAFGRKISLQCARAAIEAMKVPTEEMATAGGLVEFNEMYDVCDDTATEVWQAMISAALTPKP